MNNIKIDDYIKCNCPGFFGNGCNIKGKVKFINIPDNKYLLQSQDWVLFNHAIKIEHYNTPLGKILYGQ